jgi:hypothetical protein
MKRLGSKSRYQFISLLHELLLFFISSFILFPSHVKRIILCFVYSDDYQPSFIYPSLEEDLQPACIVDVDSVFLPQLIHKDDHCIQIPLESDNHVTLKKLRLIQTYSELNTFFHYFEPCHQLAKFLMISPLPFKLKLG